MMVSKDNLLTAGAWFCLPILVFVWTSIAAVSELTLYLLGVAVIASIIFMFIKHDILLRIVPAAHTLSLVLVVAVTGWFTSPLFFLLYLWPVYLGVRLSPRTAFAFLLALPFMIVFSAGEAEPLWYVFSFVSLLVIIPFTKYLRQKFKSRTTVVMDQE